MPHTESPQEEEAVEPVVAAKKAAKKAKKAAKKAEPEPEPEPEVPEPAAEEEEEEEPEVGDEAAEAEAAAPAASKKPRTTVYVTKEPILRWAKEQSLSRTKRTKNEDGEMEETEEIKSLSINSGIFTMLDEWAIHCLRTYFPQLVSWRYRIRNEQKNYSIVSLRSSVVEADLREMYPDATKADREMAVRNVCALASAAVWRAAEGLEKAVTLFPRDVIPMLRWQTEIGFHSMKLGEIDEDGPEAERTYLWHIVKRAPKAKTEEEEEAAAPPPKKKAKAAAPAAVTAKKSAEAAPKKKKTKAATTAPTSDVSNKKLVVAKKRKVEAEVVAAAPPPKKKKAAAAEEPAAAETPPPLAASTPPQQPKGRVIRAPPRPPPAPSAKSVAASQADIQSDDDFSAPATQVPTQGYAESESSEEE